mmetsp:Transcript_40531/g.91066  ORF Transcript_40531/g.91066 Transcript_40531/m.91066 type:complete len:207 (+) Transcript_40531:229-849(+)
MLTIIRMGTGMITRKIKAARMHRMIIHTGTRKKKATITRMGTVTRPKIRPRSRPRAACSASTRPSRASCWPGRPSPEPSGTSFSGGLLLPRRGTTRKVGVSWDRTASRAASHQNRNRGSGRAARLSSGSAVATTWIGSRGGRWPGTRPSRPGRGGCRPAPSAHATPSRLPWSGRRRFPLRQASCFPPPTGTSCRSATRPATPGGRL